MVELIEQNRVEIDALCRRFDVKRLELFGSAARNDFNPDLSDLDFLVEFNSYDTPTIADQWFGLKEELQRLLQREIDFTSPRAITNPYFLEALNRDRITLYAA